MIRSDFDEGRPGDRRVPGGVGVGRIGARGPKKELSTIPVKEVR